jgi:hypothetical protein
MMAGALAVLALLIHVAVPFVQLQFDGEEDVSKTYWPAGLAEREEVFDPVTGAGTSYALAGALILVVGFAGMYAVRFLPEKFQWFSSAGSATVGVIGAALTLHANGLWLGRGISSIVHAILGSDGPAHRFMADGMSPDYYTAVWPISAWMVVPLTLAAVWYGMSTLAREMSPEKKHHAQARRHSQSVFWILVAGATLLVVPWSIETAADNGPELEGVRDTDPFAISLYDALRLNTDSQILADATGEQGLTEYDDVASMAGLMLMPALLVLASLVGARLMVIEQNIAGRTVQLIASGLSIFALLLQIIGVILVAVFLYEANSQLDSRPAWIPLVGIAMLGIAFVLQVAAMRQLGGDSETLIADRFPEPIIYD